ncbi:hypothetical protein RhiJN_13319 [Ceratobasidium sp. AG-Ba]|nr:hypothetical protein RhiJN_13319 [Ceratobasidium sp. AG-Ba]QRW13875.1 hypothetical protein RhiLY_12874 [Ceratobasidium sp. AG-Ba]
MQHPAKKRKLGLLIPPSNTEADRKLLLSLLSRCDESTIVEALVDRLESGASMEEIDALKSLLEVPLESHQPELHCVRCHEEYLESENGPAECQIPHSDLEGVAQDEDGDELRAGFECCGKEFSKRDNICFFGKHTTNEDEVVYYGATPVDEDDEFFAQNQNIIPCDENGCDVD